MGEKSSQRQFLVKVEGIEGYFARKTGGNISAATSKAFDGGNPVPDLISAPPEAENVTCERTYDIQRDDEILRRLRPLVGVWRTTVSVTPTDRDLVAAAPPTTYPNALLVGIQEPEVDASSGDPATFALEFAISSYR